MAAKRDELIKRRKAAGKKQKDVAELFGITTSYYGMIELGVRTPRLELALDISAHFHAVPDVLFPPKSHEACDGGEGAA